MIVAELGSELEVVTQSDHAHFAGELLALWRSDGLPDHPRRQQLLFAAREHDNGWREADAAPRHRDDGGVHDVFSMPDDIRHEIWHRGTSRFVDRQPYASLLILEHALRLAPELGTHDGTNQDGANQDGANQEGASGEHAEAIAIWRRRRQQLIEQLDVDQQQLTEDYRWIDLTDTLSLATCARWPPGRHRNVAYRVTPGDVVELAIEPFPLAGATTFAVPYRRIPARAYASDTDLAVTLATARWQERPVRVVATR